MNISIIGHGQMGQLIEKCALDRNHTIASIVDPFSKRATHTKISEKALEGADVCICFTQPDVALDNIKDVCASKKNLVMGTTGWLEQMPDVQKMVKEAGTGMVYSSNFSIGVNLFFKILEAAGTVMNQFDVYDVLSWEAHHKKKKDSPSGTALTIANILLENIDRKDTIFEDKLDRSIEPNELHCASVRGGHIPGTHSVLFDSEFDTIELKHTARNRLGFATGAVLAAEWIVNEKGVFTEGDMMKQLLK